MIFENLVATEISRNARQTLTVQLDSTSFERLLKAHSTASVLAQWQSESTRTGGMDELSHVRVRNVQNAFRVRLGDGIRGWVFTLNALSGRLFLKFRPAPQRLLRITGPNMGLYGGFHFRSTERTEKQTARFASGLESPGAVLIFSLPVRTWQHCLRECGLRGRVTIPPLNPQKSLWSSREFTRAMQPQADTR